jgi:Flp pilus assembly protein TadD, contains TPR repeats
MSIIRFYISSLIIFSFSIVFCEDRGIKLYNSNKFDEAKEFYENILLEREEDAFASFGLGSTAFQQNDYSLAMKRFESALNTENIELKSSAYYNMANVLAEEQRFEESLKFYRKALVLNPNDIDSKIKL